MEALDLDHVRGLVDVLASWAAPSADANPPIPPEDAGCFLWDVSGTPEVASQLQQWGISATLATLLASAPEPRPAEVALGILSNMCACLGAQAVLQAHPGLLQQVSQHLLLAEDPGVLTEALRVAVHCVAAAVEGDAPLHLAAPFLTPPLLARCPWLAANTLQPTLLEQLLAFMAAAAAAAEVAVPPATAEATSAPAPAAATAPAAAPAAAAGQATAASTVAAAAAAGEATAVAAAGPAAAPGVLLLDAGLDALLVALLTAPLPPPPSPPPAAAAAAAQAGPTGCSTSPPAHHCQQQQQEHQQQQQQEQEQNQHSRWSDIEDVWQQRRHHHPHQQQQQQQQQHNPHPHDHPPGGGRGEVDSGWGSPPGATAEEVVVAGPDGTPCTTPVLLAAFSVLQQLLACPAAGALLLAACPLPCLLLTLLVSGQVAGEVLEALLVVLAQVPSAVASVEFRHLQRVTEVLRAAAAEDLDTLDAGWYLCAQVVTRLVRSWVSRVTAAGRGVGPPAPGAGAVGPDPWVTWPGDTSTSTTAPGSVLGDPPAGVHGAVCGDDGDQLKVAQLLLLLLRGLAAAPCPPSSAGYAKAVAAAARGLAEACVVSKQQQQQQQQQDMGKGMEQATSKGLGLGSGGQQVGEGAGAGMLHEAVEALDAALG